MSNSYTILDARAVADPETVTLKDGKVVTKLRLADNQAGPKDDKKPARFVTAKAWAGQAEALGRLAKGDVISITGELLVETYQGKDGTAKFADTMRVTSFRVHKSDKFFGRGETQADSAPSSAAEPNPFE